MKNPAESIRSIEHNSAVRHIAYGMAAGALALSALGVHELTVEPSDRLVHMTVDVSQIEQDFGVDPVPELR